MRQNNDDLNALLAAIVGANEQPRSTPAPNIWKGVNTWAASPPSSMPPTRPQDNSSLPQLGRPLTPQERQRMGIDPNDPNMYGLTPSGGLVHTLMGRVPPGRSMADIVNAAGGGMAPSSNRPQSNMIPRANKNGMTRLSAGLYRDRQGNVVRSKDGSGR